MPDNPINKVFKLSWETFKWCSFFFEIKNFYMNYFFLKTVNFFIGHILENYNLDINKNLNFKYIILNFREKNLI